MNVLRNQLTTQETNEEQRIFRTRNQCDIYISGATHQNFTHFEVIAVKAYTILSNSNIETWTIRKLLTQIRRAAKRHQKRTRRHVQANNIIFVQHYRKSSDQHHSSITHTQ